MISFDLLRDKGILIVKPQGVVEAGDFDRLAQTVMSRIEHAIVVAALLVACTNCTSSDAGAWHKAGISEQTLSQDTAECREAAQEEAARRYPYRAGSPSLGATGAILSQQRDDNSRAIAVASLLNNCMQSRGYQRTPVSR